MLDPGDALLFLTMVELSSEVSATAARGAVPGPAMAPPQHGLVARCALLRALLWQQMGFLVHKCSSHTSMLKSASQQGSGRSRCAAELTRGLGLVFLQAGHAGGFALPVGNACMCSSGPSASSRAYFGMGYFGIAAQVTCLGRAALHR